MGVDEWFSTMDRVSDKCSAVIGCLDPPPQPLIIITDGRRGRDIQLDQQRPQTAAETTQLTVRLTPRVRGYRYCRSYIRALHSVVVGVCGENVSRGGIQIQPQLTGVYLRQKSAIFIQ